MSKDIPASCERNYLKEPAQADKPDICRHCRSAHAELLICKQCERHVCPECITEGSNERIFCCIGCELDWYKNFYDITMGQIVNMLSILRRILNENG